MKISEKTEDEKLCEYHNIVSILENNMKSI